MKTKKSKKVNLEKKKGLHFLIGAIITLSMILIAFEWSSGLDNNSRDLNTITEIEFEEQMIATRREEPKPPEAKQPEVLQVLDIVDDNVLIFSYGDEFTCVHIVSKDIADSFKSFFMKLWEQAKS